MVYLSLAVGIIFIFIFYSFHSNENNLIPLQQAKKILKETNGAFGERLLFSPIVKLTNISTPSTVLKASFPIILVPDLGGSKLYRQLLNGNWVVAWGSVKAVHPNNSFSEKWKNNFIHSNKISATRFPNYIHDKFRLTTDFGGIYGIDIINKIGTSVSYSFYPLIKLLQKKYTAKQNLFGAPYDFRNITSTIDEYFKKLKDLIEYSFKLNKKPCIIVGHGLGGILCNLFLTYHIAKVWNSKDWKKKYIHLFIPITTPFLGNPLAHDALTIGTNEGIGLASLTYNTRSWYKDILQHIDGLSLMLPFTLNHPHSHLLAFRTLDPKVRVRGISVHNKRVMVPFKSQQIPKTWNRGYMKVFTESGHKSIINYLPFLEWFCNELNNA